MDGPLPLFRFLTGMTTWSADDKDWRHTTWRAGRAPSRHLKFCLEQDRPAIPVPLGRPPRLKTTPW